MAHPAEEHNSAKRSAFGKKLFVALAFLLVLGMLFLLISFAKYRKKINGEIHMPEAKMIQATLSLDKDLATMNLASSTYLADLQPGDEVRDFLENEDVDHRIVVTITNHGLVGTSTTLDERTELTLHYKLYLNSTDHLPLEFIMVDDNEQRYIAKKANNANSRYHFYPLNSNGSTEETEAEFTINKAEEIVQTYYLYMGWDNNISGSTDEEKLLSAQELTNADYRKEVEMLTLRAEIVADRGGVGYSYESKEELQNKITPVSEP